VGLISFVSFKKKTERKKQNHDSRNLQLFVHRFQVKLKFRSVGLKVERRVTLLGSRCFQPADVVNCMLKNEWPVISFFS